MLSERLGRKKTKACSLFLRNTSFSWQDHRRGHLLCAGGNGAMDKFQLCSDWECVPPWASPPATGFLCPLRLITLETVQMDVVLWRVYNSGDCRLDGFQWEHRASTQMNSWKYTSRHVWLTLCGCTLVTGADTRGYCRASTRLRLT